MRMHDSMDAASLSCRERTDTAYHDVALGCAVISILTPAVVLNGATIQLCLSGTRGLGSVNCAWPSGWRYRNETAHAGLWQVPAMQQAEGSWSVLMAVMFSVKYDLSFSARPRDIVDQGENQREDELRC
jgi:hypothetical protein